jgi:hypothetical protein
MLSLLLQFYHAFSAVFCETRTCPVTTHPLILVRFV